MLATPSFYFEVSSVEGYGKLVPNHIVTSFRQV